MPIETGFTVEHEHAIFGGIWLDASLVEVHMGDSDITEHPVEEGSDITDHIRPLADALWCEPGMDRFSTPAVPPSNGAKTTIWCAWNIPPGFCLPLLWARAWSRRVGSSAGR